MAHRLRKRYTATLAEALWSDACGSALTGHLRMHSGATSAEALWRVVCGSAMARRLRKRYVARLV